MKRSSSVIGITALNSIFLFLSILILPPVNAATSPKVGSKCTKPGLIQVVSKKTFVCAKVGNKSVWISAGESNSSSSKNTANPSPQNVPTCTTGVGTKLSAQIIQDAYGMPYLTIVNPTNCNITYSLTGSLGCNYYKNQKATIIGNSTKSLYPNQTVRMLATMAFPDANTTCQIYQKQSGAGPEYGGGILFFISTLYSAMVIGISN